MERKQDYTPEFWAEAVKMVSAQGLFACRSGKAAVGAEGDVGELGGLPGTLRSHVVRPNPLPADVVRRKREFKAFAPR